MKKTSINQVFLSWLVLLLSLLPVTLSAQSGIVITGKVTDNNGEPLPGAAVMVVGQKNTATTADMDGNYQIRISDGNSRIQFVYLGFEEQIVVPGNRTIVNVVMNQTAEALESASVVAIGYGEVRKRDISGSVVSADMGEIAKLPVASVLDGVAGRISGVQISSNDGTPGQSSNVVIRGGNSISGDNSPLYVVDGFPAENFDIGTLDPSEIESFVVLKDASATAIYGSRGANGVIVVNTKKGVASQKPIISYRGSFAVDLITKTMDMMSPYDFVAMMYERDPKTTEETYLADKTLESYRDQVGIDWQDKLFRPAFKHTHTISIRGGNSSTKYNVSGSFLDQDGLIITSNYKKYNVKMDLEQQLFKWLKAGVSVNYINNTYTGAQPTVFSGHNNVANMMYYTMYNCWTYMPINYSGSIDVLENELRDPNMPEGDYRVNPVLSTRNEYRKFNTSTLQINAFLDFKLTKHLSFKSIAQAYQYRYQAEQFNNSMTRNGQPHSMRQVNGSFSTTKTANWVNENILTYANSFDGSKHSLLATAAVTFEQQGSSKYGYGSEFIPNEQQGMASLAQGSVYETTSSIDTKTKRMSFLGRVIYSYLSRYSLTVSMRADGSSKFAKQNRWGYFPSASLGWDFGSERFLQDQKILSNGKLRASWGITGNDRISSDDMYQQMKVFSGTTGYPLGSNWETYSYLSYPGNPNLKWEKTVQANIGIDLEFFDGRIAFTGDIYRKDTKDLLLQTPLSGHTGYGSLMTNAGHVRNEGIELSLSTVNIKHKSFQWKTDFNISFNRNKVLALAVGQPSISKSISWEHTYGDEALYITEVGQPVGLMFGYVWDGVYKSEDFIYGANGIPTAKPGVPTYTANVPGDIKYKDINGDGLINADDRQVIGNPNPVHTGGFNNTFRYKNFSLSIFFKWSYGNDVFNANRLVMENGGKLLTNQFASFVNRWTPDNQDTDMHRLNSNGLLYYSSRVVEDASYLRLQSLSLSYIIKKAWLKKIHMDEAWITLSANNLYTWTNYSGFDPEVSARHSAMTQGFDFSAYPRACSYALSLNLKF